jgi:hypothetical protein
MEGNQVTRFARNWLWLCPLLAIAVAAWVLAAFGLSLWTGLFTALLLVCPALMVWGLFKFGRG